MEVQAELKLGKNIYELPLRVCYYARVSTDHELQTTSILNQVDYFKKYIESISNWVLVKGYVDEGISGKAAFKRENFMKMIQDSNKKLFDLILTKSVSRFARNTIDSIYYTNYLLEKGIGVYFLNDNINTFYSDSEFRLTLMASIAQDELRKLSESVKFGLCQSMKRGIVLGNNNLLGYRKDKGKLVVIEDEAVIVKDVFALFIKNKNTYLEVARIINCKYNKRFDSTGIKRILTNYKYKGYYCGKKSEVIDYKKSRRKNYAPDKWIVYPDYDNVPPIIKESVWDEVQNIIANKSKKELCGYEKKLFCVKHKKILVHKRKKYRGKVYHYFICSGCCSFSNVFFNRIGQYHNIEKILIIPRDVIELKVKCQET